ncbi:AlpA family phage regulatory protein [Stenotrophomonas maltophilia]|uniref:helix-turn-helix transcriptional regulator n=2 Tax=Stenotrophomonas maltophilia TaxID=40324 RepID=UPI00053B27A1|nr:AlpA family phage regulatory protein [Stenotrophomonas maltophilia]AVH92113.1 AlpA family phage regulatory protein [Stenotrophomonas maltophilia]KOO72988.1 hypothetical protein VK66_10405 [Stenotrophomonas maltophilia]MBN5037252.1 AlpA family phage regulatory protein [Stenotrophomonas maltophilia]MBN5053835.1 AlpA family phage regulatory protein [Stenotrophomonas maltophilia]HEL5329122.1 AlpA family phage regulatory protein [Stenotrophomonas maltophilia]
MAGKQAKILNLQADLQNIEVVMARTSLSRATIYRRMALGSFPSPRKIGARSVWLKADIDRFCAEVAIPESGA